MQDTHVEKIRDMFRQLQQAIVTKNYTSFIQHTLAIPQLFVDVDLTDPTTAFDILARTDVPDIINKILSNKEPTVSKLNLKSQIEVCEYNKRIASSNIGDIILMRTSIGLLQAASTRAVTDADFENIANVQNFMAVKLDGSRMLMLMMQPV